MRKSPDMLADSINNLAKARKIEDGRREMHFSITKYHETETWKASIEAKREEIELVRHQLAVLTERYKECNDPEWKERYKKGLNDLEDKLDLLLMS
jgi:transcriptional/translational regulatory protein YebC/TACO1